MTNREHILKVIAGLDDNTLCDIFIELPDEVRNKEPICGPCDFARTTTTATATLIS